MILVVMHAVYNILPFPVRRRRHRKNPSPGTMPAADFCFKAVCEVPPEDDRPGGIFTGYDKTVDIAARTEVACRVLHPERCRDARLTMICGRPGLRCAGQIEYTKTSS